MEIITIATWALAIVFLMAGGMKTLNTKEKLAEKMKWVEDFSQNQLRAIGALEIIAAVTIIGTTMIDSYTEIIPYAALGLALIMLGAALTHARRKETSQIVLVVILGVLALYVVYMNSVG